MIGRICCGLFSIALIASGCSSDGGVTGADGGATDGAAATVKVVINEVVTSADPGSKDNPTGSDWLELYNVGADRVDLTGFRIVDSANKGFGEAIELPAGTSIAGRGFLVIWFNHTTTGTPVIDKGLGADEAATLFDATGAVLDRVNWEKGDAPKGGSWGRYPDGGPVFRTVATPTPGKTNSAK